MKDLLAVAAGKSVLPSLSAITGAMANLIAVHTLDLYLVGVLESLLRTTASCMAELYRKLEKE